MKEIFIATRNSGKVKEFEAFFQERGLQVKSLLDLPDEIDVVEDGKTFEDNAIKKAETIGKRIGMPVLADDSGLEVDALQGAPGIYSARFAGPKKDDGENNQKLLRELENVRDEDRTARFVCALAIFFPNGKVQTVRGTCEGKIGYELMGAHGFGYDPLFKIPNSEQTMAQLEKHEKNKISHRAKALLALADHWDDWAATNK
ncbi:non-canonical purine NTP pyrophosphatase [Salipaludibacillus neizhouensis]|uniref:dITP/XTP pyrophosphatase n=1 Tax=Salipaludibacillus neizhouensis TaxID=885475 RepID=A0A3A9K3T1_9BACI|nr:XTP/dITP diphosphatase [Salipaludibacillus neizhouensis]RKL65968.1 non-canonical purine NTP pyrophosphatase [Salipaludibacillus neizhouensis]